MHLEQDFDGHTDQVPQGSEFQQPQSLTDEVQEANTNNNNLNQLYGLIHVNFLAHLTNIIWKIN